MGGTNYATNLVWININFMELYGAEKKAFKLQLLFKDVLCSACVVLPWGL